MLFIEIFGLAKENALLQSRLLDYEVQQQSNQRYTPNIISSFSDR